MRTACFACGRCYRSCPVHHAVGVTGPPRGRARSAMTSERAARSWCDGSGRLSALVALVSVGVLVADHVVAAGRASAETRRVQELEER